MTRQAMPAGYSPEQIRMSLEKLPRVSLANLPTPLEECKRLSEALLGPRIWMKRDDQTGLAFGGNKTRQIEFLLGDVLAQGANAIVTGAGSQSNFCRQLTAAAAKFGLKICLILMRGVKGSELQGNLLLDHLLGAEIEIVDETESLNLIPHFEKKAEKLRQQGYKSYIVEPRGRSAPLLSLGYVNAMLELVDQLAERRVSVDYLYVSAANMTEAGLALAARALGLSLKIVGISPIKWQEPRPIDIAHIANRTAEILGLKTRLSPNQILNSEDYIGEAYGIPTPKGNAALRLVAQSEGILLDPVYTAKAMAALIDDIQSKKLKREETVLFLHTGGTPALFAYAQELAQPA
jgi:D-cysteine desulfhydrase family pyridoxal phosphate-dependent enzyme